MYHTGPSSLKEKLEHMRAKREWQKIWDQGYRDHDVYHNHHKRNKIISLRNVVSLLCIGMLVIAAGTYIYPNKDLIYNAVSSKISLVASSYSSGAHSTSSENSVPTVSSIELPISIYKISLNTENYIKQTGEIRSDVSTILKRALSDYQSYGVIPYNYYEDDILKSIDSINDLFDMNISSNSVLKPYQTYCEAYFGQYQDFLQNLIDTQDFSIEKYNAFVTWQNESTHPTDYLATLFEQYEIDYSWDEGHTRLSFTYSLTDGNC